MATTRTALRSLGALAAASGLVLAGAGIASATTSTHETDGQDVSVTFTLEDGEAADTCGAVLVPPASGLSILTNLQSEDPQDIFQALADAEDVVLLKGEASSMVSLNDATPTGTVTATEVPNGMYALVAFCTSDLANISDLEPAMVLVGSPLDAISGLSSGNLLETGSALLQGDDMFGELDLGTLSSAVGDTEK